MLVSLRYWPQLAMELTQYMVSLCLDEDLIGSHPELIQELNDELLHFPKNIPKSSLIDTASSTRTAFMLIFNKYIDARATWNVRFEPEIQEEILKFHRRLDEQKRHTVRVSPRGHLSSSTFPQIGESDSNKERRANKYKALVDVTNLIMREVVQRLESSFKTYQNTQVK